MKNHKRRGSIARDHRREAGALRDAENAKLSLEDKLAKCDMRPGNSVRERARLTEAIRQRDRKPPPKAKKATKAHKVHIIPSGRLSVQPAKTKKTKASKSAT